MIAQRADTPDTVKNPLPVILPQLRPAGIYMRKPAKPVTEERREEIVVPRWRREISDMGAKTATSSRPYGRVFRVRKCLPSRRCRQTPSGESLRISRSLNTNGAAANEVVAGDAVAGEQTFWGKGGCASCHEVNGRGSDVGPDLSAAGTNSASYLRSVILNPNTPQLRRRRFFGPSVVSVKTKSGQQIRGIARAEDSYNLILAATDGKLYRLDKRDLVEEQTEHESLMPANYGQLLSETEIQNLVAYLKSLKARDLSKTIQVKLPRGLEL